MRPAGDMPHRVAKIQGVRRPVDRRQDHGRRLTQDVAEYAAREQGRQTLHDTGDPEIRTIAPTLAISGTAH
jgi:hypothetical protein